MEKKIEKSFMFRFSNKFKIYDVFPFYLYIVKQRSWNKKEKEKNWKQHKRSYLDKDIYILNINDNLKY